MLPPDPNRIKRVLIVKLSAIGDVVHALPVSAALGEAFPHWELTWIVEERAAPVVLGNPFLSDVILLPKAWYARPWSPETWRRWAGIRRDLRARRFDLALDLQGLSRSALLAWASGAPLRFGYDWLREIAPWFVRRIPRRPESVHVVDQLLDVARFLGASVPRVRFPLHLGTEDEKAAVELLTSVGVAPHAPFLAINPTAGGAGHKGWGAERLVGLLRRLAVEFPVPIVLVGGPEDQAIGDQLVLQAPLPLGNLIGRTTIKQLAAVLRRAAVHLSGDTGSAHLAAALGTPVVSLFGRSNPARLAPYGQEQRALHHREACVPVCRRWHERAPVNCSQACLAPPPICMAAITVDEVARAVRAAWPAKAGGAAA